MGKRTAKRKAAAKTAAKRTGTRIAKARPGLPSNDQVLLNTIVTPEARSHGAYAIASVPVTEGEFGGTIKGNLSVVINNAGTTLQRWRTAGVIDERQYAACALYDLLWHKVFGRQRVTASWAMVKFGLALTDFDLATASRIDARRTLNQIDDEVFFRLPLEHFCVWQNVVLHDEPAGVAGGRLGFSDKRATAAARLVVTTVAGMVADVLIDPPRASFVHVSR